MHCDLNLKLVIEMESLNQPLLIKRAVNSLRLMYIDEICRQKLGSMAQIGSFLFQSHGQVAMSSNEDNITSWYH